ncbi:hypothetical protein RYX36_022715 [Vicia faba]
MITGGSIMIGQVLEHVWLYNVMVFITSHCSQNVNFPKLQIVESSQQRVIGRRNKQALLFKFLKPRLVFNFLTDVITILKFTATFPFLLFQIVREELSVVLALKKGDWLLKCCKLVYIIDVFCS